MRLSDTRDASGQRLFSRGVIPRRSIEQPDRFYEPVPFGVVGENHLQEALPNQEMFGGWWRWRWQAVQWEQIEDLGDGARLDVLHVAENGVSASRRSLVGVVQFGFQIPLVIAVDRTVCHRELEALAVTVIYGYANQVLGGNVSTEIAQLLMSIALTRG